MRDRDVELEESLRKRFEQEYERAFTKKHRKRSDAPRPISVRERLEHPRRQWQPRTA